MAFTSCAMVDELKAASIYTDFMLGFTENWEAWAVDPAITTKELIDDKTKFTVTFPETEMGNLKYTYEGTVVVEFIPKSYTEGGEKHDFYHVDADVKVVSTNNLKPYIGTDTLEIHLQCLPTGFISDGVAVTSYVDTVDGIKTWEAANLEGVWFVVKNPDAKTETETEATE